MTLRSRILTLLICFLGGFVVTLLIYYFIFGLSPLNRIGYGIFVSLTPAIFTLLAPKFFISSKKKTGLTYLVLYMVIVVLQGVLR